MEDSIATANKLAILNHNFVVFVEFCPSNSQRSGESAEIVCPRAISWSV